MLLNDKQIRDLALSKEMIIPFCSTSVKEADSKKVLSYGTSSFGYDLRVRDGFKIFSNVLNGVVDPKNFDENNVIEVFAKEGEDYILIPPNSFALAESTEYIKVPEDILCVVYGKSTYARCGIITNVTPLEPGWEGTVTLEISNTTPLPAKVYVNEGLCQVLFMKGERPSSVYGERSGKYQNQSGITLPKV